MTDLLADFIPLERFAKSVGKHVRTVYRWTDAADGLPYTRLGNQRLIHVGTAHAWLMQRMRHPNPPRRRRGRRR
jgi:hypothetical protein